MPKVHEPWHEIMVLFVLRKLILQTHRRSHPEGLNVWFLVGPFFFFHTSYVRTTKALARLHRNAGSPEPSLVAYVISTISPEPSLVAYVISTISHELAHTALIDLVITPSRLASFKTKHTHERIKTYSLSQRRRHKLMYSRPYLNVVFFFFIKHMLPKKELWHNSIKSEYINFLLHVHEPVPNFM